MTAAADLVIVGLGKTGLSCARYCVARGIAFAVTDSRAEPPGLAELRQLSPQTRLFLGGLNAQVLAEAGQIAISPGVSLREPAIVSAQAQGVPVLGDIELFARAAHAPVLAVTGSNGKSTVTTLLGLMAARAGLNVRVGGNLGIPALDLLGDPEPDLYVLELSSFQLETTTSLNALAAVVLNISPDHMDRYDDLAAYTRAKQQAYRGDGVMVINNDDPAVRAMAQESKRGSGRKIINFGLGAPAPGEFGVRLHDGVTWLAFGEEFLLAAHELRIRGSHNIANTLAALALGHAAGFARVPMLEVLREFPGLPHRSEWVAERDGVSWFNDSKGTNVGATLAALQGLAGALPGRVVLIAGGEGKDADFAPLRQSLAAHARAVVLIGRDAAIIETALNGAVPVVHAHDMTDAVQQAQALARSGDQVLLSPACASFDMYSGYEERGRVFTAAVRALPGGNF